MKATASLSLADPTTMAATPTADTLSSTLSTPDLVSVSAISPHWLYLAAIIVLTAVTTAAGIFWFRQRQNFIKEAALRSEIEEEERRMFSFLRGLGRAIEGSSSEERLHRMIVRGATEVIGASGASLYLLDRAREVYIPAHISKSCPILTGLPAEMLAEFQANPELDEESKRQIITSHIRLATVNMKTGIHGECRTRGECLLFPDLFAEPSMANQLDDQSGKISVIAAPLRHGGVDIGILAVANTEKMGSFTTNDVDVFRSISEQTAFALGNAMAQREAAEKRQLDRELRTASEVQRILLPESAPNIAGYRLAGRNLPARIISGDYLDYIPLGDGKFAVVIADVSGKGVPAGLIMSMCRAILHSEARQFKTPAKLMAEVNKQIYPDIREDMFISMAIAVIEQNTNLVTMARAGHNAPLWFHRQSGEFDELKFPGIALGLDSGNVFERVVQDHQFSLTSGDCLLLYTDGVPEAVNSKGEEYGLQRLHRHFVDDAYRGGMALVQGIENDVIEFVSNRAQLDDVTLIAIEKL